MFHAVCSFIRLKVPNSRAHGPYKVFQIKMCVICSCVTYKFGHLIHREFPFLHFSVIRLHLLRACHISLVTSAVELWSYRREVLTPPECVTHLHTHSDTYIQPHRSKFNTDPPCKQSHAVKSTRSKKKNRVVCSIIFKKSLYDNVGKSLTQAVMYLQVLSSESVCNNTKHSWWSSQLYKVGGEYAHKEEAGFVCPEISR